MNNNTDLQKLYNYLKELKDGISKEKLIIKELQQKQEKYNQNPLQLLEEIKQKRFQLQQQQQQQQNCNEEEVLMLIKKKKKKPQLEKRNDYLYFLKENHLLQHYGGEQLFDFF
ncbi:hypothetical protein MP638_004591 [Amoeboaphelidium occidentale]|nr:hypothetical protein MP638_004591 [Amoeboaphelidium occidentale]